MGANHLPHHELTQSIIGGFYAVFNELDYGLLEALYTAALERELRARGHEVAREYAVEVLYKGEPIGFQRLDLVVDRTVVVEVKSTAMLHPIFRRQLLSYLNATKLPVGLLLHFGPEPKPYRIFRRDWSRSSDVSAL
jgi:GxxExxY protein